MRKFSAAEVLRFLAAVDAKLRAPVTLLVIGSTVHREMQFIGNPATLELNFVALVERLFGPDAASRVEQSLGSPGEDV